MTMTQKNDIREHRTRLKSGSAKTQNIRDAFYNPETVKTPCSSAPISLELIGTNGSFLFSEQLVWRGKTQNGKSRNVLKTKGNDGKTLSKSYSLPPIISPRVSAVSMSSFKSCVPSLGVGYQEKKANSLSTVLWKDKALFNRQKHGRHLAVSAQLICNGLAVFNDNLRAQDQSLRIEDSLKASDVELGGVDNNDTRGVTKGTKDQSELSDSAIEMENEMEVMDDEEEEYYTNQRITAWIVKVNASLFSSKDDIFEQTLEEQDVDTIKIYYDQD